jgi:3'(2'), 5'-bisphosphate nucleotidase
VTAADLALERLLVQGLHRWFPNDVILAEESAAPGDLTGRRIWCIDPLDGTQEFLHGLPECAVMAGLLFGREPVVGALGIPDEDLLFWGYRGGGAWEERPGGTRRLRPPPAPALAEATAIHSRRHGRREVREVLDRLRPRHTIPAGSVGFKVSRILLEEAHVYVHPGPGTAWWDSVAPAAVFTAGGDYGDGRGARLRYEGGHEHADGILFAAPGLCEEIAARLAT